MRSEGGSRVRRFGEVGAADADADALGMTAATADASGAAVGASAVAPTTALGDGSTLATSDGAMRRVVASRRTKSLALRPTCLDEVVELAPQGIEVERQPFATGHVDRAIG